MSAKLAKRLVEPDFWTCPHGVRQRPQLVETYGPEVAEVNAAANFEPDPQQQLGLDLIFAIRPDGSPASFSFCVVCARQNLKTGLFLQSVIGWLFVLDIPEIAWSSHEMRTSLSSQRELERIIRDAPSLSKRMVTGGNHGIYYQNGDERIELANGQTVWFQTRTRDGGRGLGKPKLILDEAFKLKSRILGALLPILLAQIHPQVLYGSSAPPNDPDSAVLRDVMDRGRNHKSPELSYLEWLAPFEPCADPDCLHPKDARARGIDCALDREHLIQRANPTLTTGRITMRTLLNLRQELPPPEYMRECLGWAEDPADAAGPPAINARRWSSDALRKPQAPAPVKACIVLDVEPDRSVTSIGVAGRNRDGQLIVLEHTAAGEAWVIGRLKKLRETVDVLEVALHPSGQAKTLIPPLKAAGIEFTKLTSNDLAGGCASMITKVETAEVVHVGQPGLDTAVAVARTRFVNESQRWARAGVAVPLAPLVSVSTALYRFELASAAPKTPPSPPLAVPSIERQRSPHTDPATAGF